MPNRGLDDLPDLLSGNNAEQAYQDRNNDIHNANSDNNIADSSNNVDHENGNGEQDLTHKSLEALPNLI